MNAKAVVLINSLDEGLPGPEHFNIVESVVHVEELQENGILVKLLAISADPYLRGSIKSTGKNNKITIKNEKGRQRPDNRFFSRTGYNI